MDNKGAGELGNYNAPAHKATTVRGSFMRKESAGVHSGLSSLANCDTEDASEIGIDYDRNPITGNATERVDMNPGSRSKVSEKGNSFEIC
jgi:hypothetical protein